MISVLLRLSAEDPDAIARTWAAVAAQTHPRADWEILVLGTTNGSALPGEARRIAVPDPTPVAALLAGGAAATGDLLVWLEPGLILAPDYLAIAAARAAEEPRIGAFGGRIEPQFAAAPAPELSPWLPLLGLQAMERALWSNHRQTNPALPEGGGLCVRRAVFQRYAEDIARDPRRRTLDAHPRLRTGAALRDLALSACDAGLGTALYPDLRVTRVIPAGHASRGHLLALAEASASDRVRLDASRDPQPVGAGLARSQRLMETIAAARLPATLRAFRHAQNRGQQRACQEMNRGL